MGRQIRVAVLVMLLAGATLRAGQAPAGQAPAAPPPSQTPTFKVQVDFIEVDAIVTDARGNYVRDLKKEDFQVFEDGKPQTVTNFVPIDIPIEQAERPLFAWSPQSSGCKAFCPLILANTCTCARCKCRREWFANSRGLAEIGGLPNDLEKAMPPFGARVRANG